MENLVIKSDYGPEQSPIILGVEEFNEVIEKLNKNKTYTIICSTATTVNVPFTKICISRHRRKTDIHTNGSGTCMVGDRLFYIIFTDIIENNKLFII